MSSLGKNRNILIFVLLLILIVVLNFKYLMIKYAYFFTVNQYEAGADAIVVLSGSPTTRIPRAIELVNSGFADKILITSPKPLNSTYNFELMNNLDIVQKITMKEKFSKEILVIPSLKGGATSTFDEAYDLLNYNILKGGYKHIILVTDFHHTRRSLLAFNKVFKNSGVRIETSAAYNDIFNEDNWWKSDIGISTYIMEPIKLLVYFFTSSNASFIKNN